MAADCQVYNRKEDIMFRWLYDWFDNKTEPPFSRKPEAEPEKPVEAPKPVEPSVWSKITLYPTDPKFKPDVDYVCQPFSETDHAFKNVYEYTYFYVGSVEAQNLQVYKTSEYRKITLEKSEPFPPKKLT